MQISIDRRIDLACRWLEEAESPAGGWGWVADVLPNPQNTAEVVVALSHAGRSGRELEHLLDALAAWEVVWPDGRQWVFDTPIDQAWRLRGLCRLPKTRTRDQHISRTLRELRRKFTGRGWSLAPSRSESSFATAVALVAVGEVSVREAVPALARHYLAAWQWLLADLNHPSNLDCTIAHTSWALLALSEPAFSEWRDGAYRRAVKAGLQRLIDALGGPIPVEEEQFSRGPIRDKWRHPNLAVVIQAVLRIEPAQLFNPSIRQNFGELMRHQRTGAAGEEGAFALNEAGPATTYSTTHGIQTMVMVKQAFAQASPGDVLELFCRIDGRHHTDAQKIAPAFGGNAIIMNSTAGLTIGILFTFAITMFAAFMLGGVVLTDISRKVLACVLIYFLAIGWYGYLAARLPHTPNRNIALSIYGAVTAVALPIVTYLVT
ncbi:putative Squalene cyclase C-terminal domain-containing protein [Frankia sp. AiPs1]|uniref:hypothetical protein n=1 Tax=Frankia sp. AiPa1 TaxID=573492 RepID=UPI00202B4493|nr:hypothetical protein [Frankia sp. AiPa1]MCL9759807.1 hypothetical protein [Frankia sp. AiPa1]